jgi:hypothetical protein
VIFAERYGETQSSSCCKYAVTKRCFFFLAFAVQISSKYDGVPTTIVRVNVAADDKVDYWCLCSHPGDCQTSHGGQSVKTVKAR